MLKILYFIYIIFIALGAFNGVIGVFTLDFERIFYSIIFSVFFYVIYLSNRNIDKVKLSNTKKNVRRS